MRGWACNPDQCDYSTCAGLSVMRWREIVPLALQYTHIECMS